MTTTNTVQVNIGLERSARFFKQKYFNKTVGTGMALAILEKKGIKVIKYRTQHSTTENTLIAVIDASDLQKVQKALESVSDTLKQDCVALWMGGKDGKLLGTYAHIWGQFDPQYFIKY